MGSCGGAAVELWNAGVIALLADTDPGLLMSILAKVGIWASVAIGVGLVIFVHELGHFVAAKSCGVKCEKFYVGFDVPITIGPITLPRTLGKFQWGETEYGLGIIPLGGYVKMLGQDDDPRRAAEENERIKVQKDSGENGSDEPEYELDPRSYQAKSVLQRMIIISAGVIVNAVTAVMFAGCAFWFGVPYTPTIVGSTSAGDPAWVAGVEPGAQIVSVGTIQDDAKLHFDDMSMEIMEHGLREKDAPIEIKVKTPDGKEASYKLTPTSRHDPQKLRVRIGVAPQLAARLPSEMLSIPNSAASKAIDSSFAGAEIVKLNGADLAANAEGDVLASEILLFEQNHPDQPMDLTVALSDGTESQVTIAPQGLRTIGGAFATGPITGNISGGKADLAGIK